MKIIFGGGLGRRSSVIAKCIEDLSALLKRANHTVLLSGPHATPQHHYDTHLMRISECDIMLAMVDEWTGDLGADINEAIRMEKPVLCLYNGQRKIESVYLLGASTSLDEKGFPLLQLTHIGGIPDAATKVCDFARIVEKSKAA